MNLLARTSSRVQVWLLRHPSAWTRWALTAIYNVELILYAGQDPRRYHDRRRRAIGSNYAALGRLILGDHADAAGVLRAPQRRGHFLAQGRMMPERVAPDFTLFQHDREAGGDGRHEVLYRWLTERWMAPAQERQGDPKLAEIVREGVAELRRIRGPLDERAVRPAVNRMTARYMLWALLRLEPDEARLAALVDLSYSDARTKNYASSAITPLPPPGFLLGALRERSRDLAAFLASSPLFDAWGSGPDDVGLTRERLGELLLALVSIAALGGSGNLLVNLLVHAPDAEKVDVDDPRALLGAVLEAARILPPVHLITTVLTEPREFRVHGRPQTFPAGTEVAASFVGGAFDPDVFPDPFSFDPTRDNLVRDLLSFNAVGFHPETRPDARRACPGRNVAVRYAGEVFTAFRRDATSA